MKLYSESVSSISYAGKEIKKNKDGSFDVPDENAAHAQEVFGLRPTPSEAKVEAAAKKVKEE